MRRCGRLKTRENDYLKIARLAQANLQSLLVSPALIQLSRLYNNISPFNYSISISIGASKEMAFRGFLLSRIDRLTALPQHSVQQQARDANLLHLKALSGQYGERHRQRALYATRRGIQCAPQSAIYGSCIY
jgi:hypothetical protein